MTSIKVLALREKRAEADRKHAEEGWRRAWWATTMALGDLDPTERANAVGIVVETTGQSRGYITSRAKTGAAFHQAGYHKIADLPPRMSVELVTKKIQITDEVIEGLKNAEESGMSLREFSATLTGKAWADTAAGASPEKIEQIFIAQPEVAAEVIADNPELFSRARELHFRKEVERHNREGRSWDQAPEEIILAEQRRSSVHNQSLEDLVMATKRIRRLAEDTPLSDKARANLRWVIAELTAITEGEAFIGDIEEWLEGVS